MVFWMFLIEICWFCMVSRFFSVFLVSLIEILWLWNFEYVRILCSVFLSLCMFECRCFVMKNVMFFDRFMFLDCVLCIRIVMCIFSLGGLIVMVRFELKCEIR